MAALPRCLLAALCLAAGCSGSRVLSIDSRPAARIEEWGGAAACAQTPCAWSFSRETCGLYDSSRGYIILTAAAPDGRKLTAPALKTCGIKKGTRLSFQFPTQEGGDCLVTISAGGRESRHPGCEGLVPAGARRRRP